MGNIKVRKTKSNIIGFELGVNYNDDDYGSRYKSVYIFEIKGADLMGEYDKQTSVEQQLFDDNIHWRKEYQDLEKAYKRLLKAHQGRWYTIKRKQDEIQDLTRKLNEATGTGKAKYKNKSRKGKRRQR